MEPTQTQYEGVAASPAVQMLCRLFLEKVNREQQELMFAASQTDQERVNQGFVLNVERGIWVRPIDAQAPAPEKPELVTD